MGDPRKPKKLYDRPFRPWNSARIKIDKDTMETYGLRRKKEIWKAESILRGIRRQARELQSSRDEIQIKQLMDKLKRLNLIGQESILDDVLSLSLKDILDRRLQTIILTRGFANTTKQARQLITHGHVVVGDRKIFWPSYMVPAEMEDKIEVKVKVTE